MNDSKKRGPRGAQGPDKPEPGEPDPGKRVYWLDSRTNVTKVYYTLVTICGLLFAIDLFFHKHEEFPIEGWFGFYPIYGFVGAVGLVLAAKVLRLMVMRPESYYDYEFEDLVPSPPATTQGTSED